MTQDQNEVVVALSRADAAMVLDLFEQGLLDSIGVDDVTANEPVLGGAAPQPSILDIGIGDTIDVYYLTKEGEKERVQLFTGTVIRFQGAGIRRTVTVRRIVAGEGIERTFALHSPRVADVKLKRRGIVRRAKLYYLRDRAGKAKRMPGAKFKIRNRPSGKKPGTRS